MSSTCRRLIWEYGYVNIKSHLGFPVEDERIRDSSQIHNMEYSSRTLSVVGGECGKRVPQVFRCQEGLTYLKGQYRVLGLRPSSRYQPLWRSFKDR